MTTNLDPDELHAIVKHQASAIELIDAAEAEIRHATDSLINLSSQEADNERQLDIDWIGQNTSHNDDDGGPACLCMWLNYLDHDLTIDNVSKATGLGRGFHATTSYNLITAAKVYGLAIRRVTRLDLSYIRREIDAERPLIVLVHYASLEKRWTSFSAGHWLLVTGYNDKFVFYNDPLAPDDHGKAIAIANAAFEKAMLDASTDGNTPRQGLIAT